MSIRIFVPRVRAAAAVRVFTTVLVAATNRVAAVAVRVAAVAVRVAAVAAAVAVVVVVLSLMTNGAAAHAAVSAQLPSESAASAPLPADTAATAPLPTDTATTIPLPADTTATATCTVTDGLLVWGVKDTFRAYVSGSIANGDWQATDGASYSTPLFTWATPTGEIDADTGTGTISFVGTVRFTGHEGVLDLTIANPAIELFGDGTGRLFMDARSNDPQGQLKIDETQVHFADLAGISATAPSSGVYEFTNAQATLTAPGADAFGAFYEGGDQLDPISASVQLSPCEGDATGTEGAGESADAGEQNDGATVTSADGGVPWVPLIIGGIALVVIVVTSTLLVRGRNKPDVSDTGASPTTHGEDDA